MSTTTTTTERLSQADVMALATKKGAIAFGTTSIASFGLSYWLHLNNATYRSRFAISAKVGLPLMASLFMGSSVFELTMFDAHRYPENFQVDGAKTVPKSHKSIPIHHWIMNRIHERPFYFATVMALPLAGSIMYTRMKEPHLTFSQALLQTRVMGQFGVLAIVLTTLGVRAYVDSHGKFPEGEE